MNAWLDPGTPRGAALLDRMINQQAQIVAYIDDYKMLTLTTLPAILLLLVMRLPKRPAAIASTAAVTSK